MDKEALADDLTKITNTGKTELLFIGLILELLKSGGRAGVIVPDGVLFGASNAHKSLRKEIIDKHKLEGVISMPSGVFRPYTGVSTAILFFTKTSIGGTDKVWFYDMEADGLSLDDKGNYAVGLNKKQSNLINALDDYTQAWLEQVGEKSLATEVNEKIGISKGVQESIDYLKKLEKSKDRGPSLGGR